MAVPKKKKSKSRSKMGRAHKSLNSTNVVFDKQTGEPKLSHHISLVDGYYNGRQVLNIKKSTESEDNNMLDA